MSTDEKVPWAPEIPTHWAVRKAWTLTQHYQRPVREEDETVTAFRDGQVTLRKNRRIDGFTEALQEIGYQGVRDGDIVIHGMDGFAGAIGISDSNGKMSPVVHIHRPIDGLADSRFLVHAVREAAAKGYVQALAKGIRERSTSFDKGTFRDLRLPVPPLDEQRSIADYLDRETAQIDKFIAESEELIALLKERRTAMIAEAVRKGLDPTAPFRDSGVEWLGEIPWHWEAMQLKRITPVRRGASPRPIDDPIYFDEGGRWAWVRIQDVTAGGPILTKTAQTLSDLGASLSVKLQPGDLFLSIAATVGVPCIAGIDCCIHDGFVYFPALPEESVPFLFRVFEAGEVFKGLGKYGTQLNLNTDTVGACVMPFPPLSEQRRIVEHLDDQTARIDEAVATAREGIALARERRAALISAAVTGKIDIGA